MKIDTNKDFGTRECPGCAMEVPANQNRCDICGYEFPHASPTKQRLTRWGALAMLIMFVIVFLRLL